jgi:hypothetical protein
MARPRSTATDPIEAKLELVAARLDDVAKLLAILVARDRSLQDAVGDLSGVGLKPTRVSELLGTTPGYAKVAADRARKRKITGRKRD